jgi:hypothetical protein
MKKQEYGQIIEDKNDPNVDQRQSLLEKSMQGLDIKTVEVRVTKNTEQILMLQQQIKEQYSKNAHLVQI